MLVAAEAPKRKARGAVLAGKSASWPTGLTKASAERKHRAAASAIGVPPKAASVHQTKEQPEASILTRCRRVRHTPAGGGARSTGAVITRAPPRYSPTMKAE